MHTKLSRGVCLIIAVMFAAFRGFAGDSPASAGTNPISIPNEYLQQLAARISTNHSKPATNSAAASTATETNLIPLDILDDTHKLGLGDRISYRVVEDKEDSKQLFVMDSGELEIPYLGRVAATGKTCAQLAGQIKTVLEKKYYYKATVVISVDLMNKTRGKIYLAGRVRVPGYQDIPGDEVFTVSKAILRAGGFGDFADQRRVQVTRKRNGTDAGSEVITVDVARILEKGQAGNDLELTPDDRVFVPSKLLNF